MRSKTIVSDQSAGIGSDEYYGYQNDLLDTVTRNLNSFGIDLQNDSVHLIKGLLQETMRIDQPVAFAHIDVDWYEPVMFCLRHIFPRLVTGGSMIFDDYHDWGGCRKAVDEYLRTCVGQFEVNDRARHLKVIRVKKEHFKIERPALPSMGCPRFSLPGMNRIDLMKPERLIVVL
jgi:asparagine synthase (glutamine-hydrolysing)